MNLIANHTNKGSIKVEFYKISEFCNISMKSWLQVSDIEIYLPHNEG